MLVRPSHYAIVTSYGVGNIKTVALHDAFSRLGIQHLQFTKVTSVIPYDAKEIDLVEFQSLPAGTIVPAVMSTQFVHISLKDQPPKLSLHGASLFFVPYIVTEPSRRFILVLEDTWTSEIGELRLVSDDDSGWGLQEEYCKMWVALYRETTQGKFRHFLPTYNPCELFVASAACVRIDDNDVSILFYLLESGQDDRIVIDKRKVHAPSAYVCLMCAVLLRG